VFVLSVAFEMNRTKIFDMGEFLSESEPRCTLQSLSIVMSKGFPLPSLSQSMVLQCYL